ncbi:MAG: hypothetical protein LBG60_10970 [Bifidobacteriaceae bacterium]|jgi:ABC-type transport system involved in cytochrome bd biosynthesis fused ATPase/permease subunit|nr:hypothetical protein [Bifidobacteriaceae bacterium]
MRLEVIKALSRQAKTLILDEPTAVLAPQATDQLLGIMRQLVGAGAAAGVGFRRRRRRRGRDRRRRPEPGRAAAQAAAGGFYRD